MNTNPMTTRTKPLSEAPHVWRVIEEIEYDKKITQQECWVLATSALEAAEIVGEDEMRKITEIRQVSFISGLPGNRYKIVPIQTPSPGEKAKVEVER